MNRLSPILSNPSSASSTLPGDSLDNATARPTAIPLGERGTCPNDSSSDHAQHVTPPTAADLGKLQYKKGCAFDSSIACFNVASAYIEGIGVIRDVAAGRDPLIKACDLGEWIACQTYCQMLGLNRMGEERCQGPQPHGVPRYNSPTPAVVRPASSAAPPSAQGGMARAVGSRLDGTYTGPTGQVAVLTVDDHTVKVEFNLQHGTSSGFAEGTAGLDGNVATYTSSQYGACSIRMTFAGPTLTVKQTGVPSECGFGHGVWADGTYARTQGSPTFRSR